MSKPVASAKFIEQAQRVSESTRKVSLVAQNNASLLRSQVDVEFLKKTRDLLSDDAASIDAAGWQGRCMPALLLRIVDGDTVRIGVVDHNLDANGSHVVDLSVRLYGIDTAEMRPRRADPNRDAIIELARQASAHLGTLLRHEQLPLIYVYFLQDDKYGRPLAIVLSQQAHSLLLSAGRSRDPTFANVWDRSINVQMINDGFAVPYTGGQKWSYDEMTAHCTVERQTSTTHIDSFALATGSKSRSSAPRSEFTDTRMLLNRREQRPAQSRKSVWKRLVFAPMRIRNLFFRR